MIDIYAWKTTNGLRATLAFVDGAADFPNLRAWADRMGQRPGVQAGMRLLNET